MSRIPENHVLDIMENLLSITSDFTRLKILYSILDGEKNVTEIVNEVGASQSLISHQLQILRRANLVTTRKEGTKVFYALADEHVAKLLEVVEEHAKEEI